METLAPDEVEKIELQKTLDRKRAELEGIANRPETKFWLAPCAGTENGTSQLLEELEKRVEREEFTQSLVEERRLAQSQHSFSIDTTAAPLSGEVLTPEWWEPVSGPLDTSTVPEVTGEYVVVEHSDVVDALAAFLAAYIVALPEGRSMEPKQLQQAVSQALKEICKGKVRKLWDWGRFLYRAAAMSYGAFAAYTNPWIAEAVLRAVFTCARFARTFW